MITEDYVSFEVAKLLKEKGFDENCPYIFHKDTNGLMPCNWHIRNSEIDNDWGIALPTQQMAMRWLREVQKINIEIITYWTKDKNMVYGNRMVRNNVVLKEIDVSYYSYEQAVEVAIKYCLENLI